MLAPLSPEGTRVLIRDEEMFFARIYLRDLAVILGVATPGAYIEGVQCVDPSDAAWQGCTLEDEDVRDILHIHEEVLRETHPILHGCRLTPNPKHPVDTLTLQLHYHPRKRRQEHYMAVLDVWDGQAPDREVQRVFTRWVRVESIPC